MIKSSGCIMLDQAAAAEQVKAAKAAKDAADAGLAARVEISDFGVVLATSGIARRSIFRPVLANWAGSWPVLSITLILGTSRFEG